jgi:Zn-dependent M28 family amino/carboxypeptidase
MLLETAVQLEGYTPSNTLRFAWWGAEESGLVGSDTYLTSLSAAEVEAIALYLGLHMVGSPNYVRFIHDGDQFTSSPGSSAIEETLRKHFQREGLPVEEEVFTGGSIPLFEATNIPAGGLFGGAERIKTPEQALVYGGTAGEQYDPCFHLACDTFPNVSLSALDEFSDAAAWTIFKFSRSTESVNGVP